MRTKSKVLDREFDFKTVHIGLMVDENLWQHDKWTVVIEGEVFEYSTGIGHREPNKNKWRRGMVNFKGYKNEAEYYLNGRFKQDKNNLVEVNKKINSYTQVKPLDIDDVLYSLIMDSTTANESFEDFCSMFGYDEDSRKALRIYEGCQKNRKKMKTFIIDLESAQEKFQAY